MAVTKPENVPGLAVLPGGTGRVTADRPKRERHRLHPPAGTADPEVRRGRLGSVKAGPLLRQPAI